MKLRCKKCNYEWNYTGERGKEAYITCPNCHNKGKRETLEKEANKDGIRTRMGFRY